MNFYRFFPGDYIAKTGELTLAEHGAYCLMLHMFYHTEKPLPTGSKLYRLLRCESKADRDAVDLIVNSYWIPTPEGLVNSKANGELDRALKLADRNKENGKKGGRPAAQSKPNYKPKQNPLGSGSVISGVPFGKATPEPDNYTGPGECDFTTGEIQ